jgi:catechol 2,3-dioxygenase-like lactoylglutathione lyase family enzyme
MIGYVTLGTNDLDRAAAFYDELLAEFGAKRRFQTERGIFYSSGAGPTLAITTPFDKQPATGGNGTMVALATDAIENVNKVYEKALALGGKDEGAPGARTESFYGAYFRDLDGNKLAVFCSTRKK